MPFSQSELEMICTDEIVVVSNLGPIVCMSTYLLAMH